MTAEETPKAQDQGNILAKGKSNTSLCRDAATKERQVVLAMAGMVIFMTMYKLKNKNWIFGRASEEIQVGANIS